MIQRSTSIPSPRDGASVRCSSIFASPTSCTMSRWRRCYAALGRTLVRLPGSGSRSFIGGRIAAALLGTKALKGPKVFRPGPTPRRGVVEALLARELKFVKVMDDAASYDWRALKIGSPALPSWAPKINLGDRFQNSHRPSDEALPADRTARRDSVERPVSPRDTDHSRHGTRFGCISLAATPPGGLSV